MEGWIESKGAVAQPIIKKEGFVESKGAVAAVKESREGFVESKGAVAVKDGGMEGQEGWRDGWITREGEKDKKKG